MTAAIDPDDPVAPPRRNGELVFDAPWQGRAFAMCVALLEREGLAWEAFRPHLVAAVQADRDAPYYEAFVAALERFVAERAAGVGERQQVAHAATGRSAVRDR